MSACYKYHENQLLNTEGLFNTWVKEEAGRNLSHPVPTPQSADATAESVLPHHRLCKDWEGMGERKERRRSFQKNWNYGDKEAAMGEGWGLPKGECVEQIICHKSLCCCSWQNNLLGFFFFIPLKKLLCCVNSNASSEVRSLTGFSWASLLLGIEHLDFTSLLQRFTALLSCGEQGRQHFKGGIQLKPISREAWLQFQTLVMHAH